MMPLATLVVVLFGCGQVLGNAEHDLAAQLLNNYPQPSAIRPVEDPDDAVPLQIDYNAHSIVEFNPHTAQLTIAGWLRMTWMDAFLTWDSEEHNVDSLRLNLDHFWRPAFRSYQGIGDKQEVYKGVVLSDGKVIWIPPTQHHVQCEEGEDHFHYMCRFNIGSWAYAQSQVATTLFRNSTGFNARYFRNHPQWNLDVEGSSAEIIGKEFPCCPGEIYESLELRLSIRHVDHEGHGSHHHGHGHGHHDSHESSHDDDDHQ